MRATVLCVLVLVGATCALHIPSRVSRQSILGIPLPNIGGDDSSSSSSSSAEDPSTLDLASDLSQRLVQDIENVIGKLGSAGLFPFTLGSSLFNTLVDEVTKWLSGIVRPDNTPLDGDVVVLAGDLVHSIAKDAEQIVVSIGFDLFQPIKLKADLLKIIIRDVTQWLKKILPNGGRRSDSPSSGPSRPTNGPTPSRPSRPSRPNRPSSPVPPSSTNRPSQRPPPSSSSHVTPSQKPTQRPPHGSSPAPPPHRPPQRPPHGSSPAPPPHRPPQRPPHGSSPAPPPHRPPHRPPHGSSPAPPPHRPPQRPPHGSSPAPPPHRPPHRPPHGSSSQAPPPSSSQAPPPSSKGPGSNNHHRPTSSRPNKPTSKHPNQSTARPGHSTPPSSRPPHRPTPPPSQQPPSTTAKVVNSRSARAIQISISGDIDIEKLENALANVNFSDVTIAIPRIPDLTKISELPALPGLADATKQARKLLIKALDAGAATVPQAIETALNLAIKSANPSSAIVEIVGTILETYLGVAQTVIALTPAALALLKEAAIISGNAVSTVLSVLSTSVAAGVEALL